jgi:hypothetical protein
MRRALALASLLCACGGAQRGGAPAIVGAEYAYEVVLDPDLAHMQVTFCPRDAPLPAALVPVHDEGNSHVVSPVLVRFDTVLRSLPTAPRIDLADAPPDACVRWDVDLATCTPNGPTGCARIGRDLFAPTSTWLLAPETRHTAAHYDVHFALPPGVIVTPITESAADDPTRVRFDERNFAFVTYLAFVHAPPRSLAVPGACVDVALLDGSLEASPDALAHWISAATAASTRVTGMAPFDRATLLVAPSPLARTEPVLFGVAGRGMRPAVTLLVSPSATEDALVPDWTLTHELSHLLTAYVEGEDTWLSEGLATYYEEVLRARQGSITEEAAWTALLDGFDRGRREMQDGTLRDACRTMHVSHAYTRVYWQGAAIVFLADVAYRRAGTSLDAAVARAWPHRTERTTAAQLVAWLDGPDDRTFADVAASCLDAGTFPDVDSALAWLGVVRNGVRITFLHDAPGAGVRRSLMNDGAPVASNPSHCSEDADPR